MRNEGKTKETKKTTERLWEKSHYGEWFSEWRKLGVRSCVYTVYSTHVIYKSVRGARASGLRGAGVFKFFFRMRRQKRPSAPIPSSASSFSFKNVWGCLKLNVFLYFFSAVVFLYRFATGARKKRPEKNNTGRIWWLAEGEWRARVEEELSDF